MRGNDNMPVYKKTPFEKLETRIGHIDFDDDIQIENRTVEVLGNKILHYSESSIDYTQFRYFPSRVESITADRYCVSIPLTHDNINLLSSNIINPPKEASYLTRQFEMLTDLQINKIVIGAESNKVENRNLYITKDLFTLFKAIYKEESRDKILRVNQRSLPLIRTNYSIECPTRNNILTPNYSVMLQELLDSGSLTDKDFKSLIEKLNSGTTNKIVIEHQISKQVSWLISTIQKIIDEPFINKQRAKDLGKELFHFKKSDINGEEQLLELILANYGKNTLFGVSGLLHTKKFVQNANGLPKCQFDLILVNYLNDIEVVELKRASQTVLDYDQNRNKFYPSKDLSIAIAQAERYISTFHNGNNTEYMIDGKTIRDFVQYQFGGILDLQICRPKALIIIGTSQSLTCKYENSKAKAYVSKDDFTNNGNISFNELRNSFKNINILTYSELLDTARLRLGTID